MTPLQQILQELEYSRNKGHHNHLEMQNLINRLHRLYGEYELLPPKQKVGVILVLLKYAVIAWIRD